MSERNLDSNYTDNYADEEKQCQHCTAFRSQNGQCICLSSSDKTFEEILDSDGEISPTGHCDFFQSID